MAFLKSLFLAALYAALSTACQGGPSISTESGIPWELAEIRAATLRDIRYEFRLSIPATMDEPITGSVTVSFYREDDSGHDLVLDFKDPGERVLRVARGEQEVEWAAENDHIRISADELQAGTNEVTIDFRAGDESLNRNPDFLFTLFVPDRAHFAVPLFDQPNLKARFQLTLEVPQEWAAVSNGSVQSEETAGVRRTIRFTQSAPISSYLFAFAAGVFQVESAERAGRTMRLLHRETDTAKVALNLEAIFDLHETALVWLEEYTGIPYPFEKFDFALIPSFQYGGMEHPGAVFYRDASLFLDASATQNQYLGRASLIAHETAHMWFGNLVTMEWFNDVWMKEVFANFMAAKIVHPSFPEVNHDLRFMLAHHPRAYAIDRSEGSHPIRQELANLNEAGSVYGAIIYQKAPIMMRQLELLLGEGPFRRGLGRYLDDHRYGNATWPDLIALLDAETEADVSEWSRVWVEEAGRPVVSAFLTAGQGVNVTQIVVMQEDVGGGERIWPQSVSVLLDYGDSTVVVPVRLDEKAVSLESARGELRPQLIIPDVTGSGYGHFHLGDSSRVYLLDHLTEIEDPLVRGTSWLLLWDAVLEGEVSAEAFLDLTMQGISKEPVEQNLQLILGYVRTVFWDFLEEGDRSARSQTVEALLWRSAQGTGSSSVRSSLFRTYRDIATSEESLELLRAVWEGEELIDGLVLSTNDEITLSFELAVRDPSGAEALLKEQRARLSNPDRLARFDFIRPALHAEAAQRERFFATLSEVGNRAHEPWVLTALSYLHHPLRREHSTRFVEPSLALVEEIQRTGDIFFPKRWLDSTLGAHNSPEVEQMVRDFLGERPDYPIRLRQKMLQAADPLFRAVRIRAAG